MWELFDEGKIRFKSKIIYGAAMALAYQFLSRMERLHEVDWRKYAWAIDWEI